MCSRSPPAIAEMEKILENTYRNVNIGLVNELAILCDKMGINLWEVIEAAKTKPYGFQAFYPGPGLGGHCIPLDPYYLSWKAREYGFHTSMIESSMMINDKMPEYCVERASKILNEDRKPLNGSKILILGVAYKQDIDDYRESPAIKVIEILERCGTMVDSMTHLCRSIPTKEKNEKAFRQSLPRLSRSTIGNDYHSAYKSRLHHGLIKRQKYFDTKNAMKDVVHRKNIILL